MGTKNNSNTKSPGESDSPMIHPVTGKVASPFPAVDVVLESIAAQRTIQHQTIEAVRQFNHALVGETDSGDGPSEHLHTEIDSHCDTCHEVIDLGWTAYEQWMTTTVGITRAASGQPSDSGATSDAGDTPPEPPAIADRDLTSIDGIGEEYQSRLANEGIETIEDLASASEDLADAIDVATANVQYWIDQAADELEKHDQSARTD